MGVSVRRRASVAQRTDRVTKDRPPPAPRRHGSKRPGMLLLPRDAPQAGELHPARAAGVASQLSECGGAGTGCGWCIPFLKQLHRQAVEGGDTTELEEMTPAEYERRRAAYIRAGKVRRRRGRRRCRRSNKATDRRIFIPILRQPVGEGTEQIAAFTPVTGEALASRTDGGEHTTLLPGVATNSSSPRSKSAKPAASKSSSVRVGAERNYPCAVDIRKRRPPALRAVQPR